jgi:hypothetical protein
MQNLSCWNVQLESELFVLQRLSRRHVLGHGRGTVHELRPGVWMRWPFRTWTMQVQSTWMPPGPVRRGCLRVLRLSP